MAFLYDLTGTLLDRRYQITGLLGKGGMGHVYDAVHVALEQRVAIKVLHPRFAAEERFRERFIREARSASRISHRNVVRITDYGDTPDGSVYFVMELLDGHDIGEELRVSGAMAWPRARHILLQAVGALRAAHTNDIVHRDIKPGNCFLTVDKQEGTVDFVKLLDFGIAKVGSDSHADAQGKGLTGTGEVFGTAAYMAPEQARGGDLDARSDMYSLGIMAYEMLTGRVPFTGVNAIHVITRHLNDPPAPLRELEPTIPANVEALVLKTIAKEPDQRYASMSALEHALRSIPEAAVPPRGRTQFWGPGGNARPASTKSGTLGSSTQPTVPRMVATPGKKRVVDTMERTAVVSPPSASSGGRAVKRTLLAAPKSPSAEASGVAPPPRVPPSPRSNTADTPRPAMRADGTNPPPPGSWDRSTPPPSSVSPPSSVPPPAPMMGAGSTNPPPGSWDRSAPPPSAMPPPAPMMRADGTPPPPGRWDRSTPPPSPVPPPAPMMMMRADGTNPPPGSRDGSVPPPSAWVSGSSSTGPLIRAGDSSAETGPQAWPVAGPSTATTILLVGILVIFVGGLSALGTAIFLLGRDSAEPSAQPSSEPEVEPSEQPKAQG